MLWGVDIESVFGTALVRVYSTGLLVIIHKYYEYRTLFVIRSSRTDGNLIAPIYARKLSCVELIGNLRMLIEFTIQLTCKSACIFIFTSG